MDIETLERSYVERAVALAVLGLAALVAGNLAEARLNPEPSPFERTLRCLEYEKGYTVFDPSVESVPFRVGVDAVRTVIEGNPVTIAVAASVPEAKLVEAAARMASGSARVERREHVVYEWGDPPSPTQRQHAYDCEYLDASS